MAAEVEISSVYLARAFKAAIGQSPHRYVLGRRIDRAKELLRNTDLPVIDVALAAGFSSQSHLSYWFQRYLGVSPANGYVVHDVHFWSKDSLANSRSRPDLSLVE